MAGSCSTDLRSRVLEVVEAGETPEAAARRFAVTRSTAYRGMAAARDGKRREAKPVTTLSRLHGRSPRGTRACASAPFGHWTRVTMLGALGAEGIVGAMSVAAATNGAVFCAYLEQRPLLELRRSKPDAVLVMDNLPAHETSQVRALLDHSGLAYRYLPAYSPDLNPIEPAWAKAKAELRRVAAHTTDALHKALGPALARITPQDAAGFSRHCGCSCPMSPAKCFK